MLFRSRVDPKSKMWRDLGVRYIVLPTASTDPEFLAKTTLRASSDIWIYELTE